MAVVSANIHLPESLLSEIQSAAQTERRSADEVITDAVHLYLEHQAWRRFVQKNEVRARAKGLSEDDVDRLIAETRTENLQHGR